MMIAQWNDERDVWGAGSGQGTQEHGFGPISRVPADPTTIFMESSGKQWFGSGGGHPKKYVLA